MEITSLEMIPIYVLGLRPIYMGSKEIYITQNTFFVNYSCTCRL